MQRVLKKIYRQMGDTMSTTIETERLLNRIPGGLGIYEILENNQFKLLFLNDTYFQILHDTRENRQQFKDTAFFDVCHPDDAENVKEILKELLQKETAQSCVCRVIDGNGDYKWFRLDMNHVNCNGRRMVFVAYTDIDDLVVPNRMMEAERKHWEHALVNAMIAQWHYNAKTGVLVQSEAAMKQNGLPARLENMPENTIQSGFVHPDSAEDYRWLFALPEPGSPNVRERDIRVKRVDRNGYCDKQLMIIHLFDKDENYQQSFGISKDISASKAAERRYKKQMQQMAEMDAANLIGKMQFNLTRDTLTSCLCILEDAVVTTEADTWETSLKKIAGTIAYEKDRKKFYRLFNRKTLMDNYREDNDVFSLEYCRKSDKLPPLWVHTEVRLLPEPESKELYGFVYSYDISERHNLKEMVRSIMNMDYDYMAVLDVNTSQYALYLGDNVQSSPVPAACSFNYEDEMERFARLYIPPEEIEKNIEDMRIERIKQELEHKDVYSAFCNVREIDGSLSRKKVKFYYMDRAAGRVLITRSDITDALYEETQKLEKLQTAMMRAEEMNRAKSDFLTRMAHDLRKATNSFLGLAALTHEPQQNPDVVKAYLNKIFKTGSVMLELVDDCLKLEESAEGKLALHPQCLPYKEFRESINAIIEPLCEKKGIEFIHLYLENSKDIYVDKARFLQIFVNLLTNAVNFTPEGGEVELHIYRKEKKNGYLDCDFMVRDTGIGMTREFQSRMFLPFEKENEAQDQARAGLGLPIVKDIVELMGGEITVRSEKGFGTVVVVHLVIPLADCAGEKDKTEPPEGLSENLTGQKILLIEDNPEDALKVSESLLNQGVKLTTASSGEQGLAVYAESEPDTFGLLILDLHQPIMNVNEAAAAIRALSRDDAASVPIIAVIEKGNTAQILQALDSGINAHLVKPIEQQKMTAMLQAFLKLTK